VSELVELIDGQNAAVALNTSAAEVSSSEVQSLRRATQRYVSRRRVSRGNEWSSEDLRRLRELAAAGTAPEAIATTLRRTASAIRNKAGMHGISLRGPR
jgi:hypothetical protein